MTPAQLVLLLRGEAVLNGHKQPRPPAAGADDLENMTAANVGR